MRRHRDDRLVCAGRQLGRFGVVLALLLSTAPWPARSELRPLVREMLENLASLDEIGAGIAVGDFERVQRAAADLDARAGRLTDFDVTRLGVDASKKPVFNAHLLAQQQNARMIGKAAKGEDGALVFRSVRSLLEEACVACHRNFRDRENLMRPSVVLMTSFLDAWQDINRGMLTDDFDLVARRAHDVQVIGRVFTMSQVIQTAFGINEAEEIADFRGFLREVIRQARQIERAADEEEFAGVIEGTQQMWADGCLACHEQFRDPD